MPKPIEDYTDPTALRNIMANADRLGDIDKWRRVFRRLCVLEGQIGLEGVNEAEPLHRDFYETLAAYE